MNARAKLEATDRREELFAAAGYRCVVCGRPLRRAGTAQLAHRVPKTVANLRRYGARIIHHPRNLAPVCDLTCNAAVLIGNNPRARDALIEEIRDLLDEIERSEA